MDVRENEPWRPPAGGERGDGVHALLGTTTAVGARRLLVRAVMPVAIAIAVLGSAGTALAAAPANLKAPHISGKAIDEALLVASAGTWSGSPAYSYQWERCNSAGAECAEIAGATTQKRKNTHADVGHTLRVTVTATNGEGSAERTTPATAVIAPSKVAKLRAPTISGTIADGKLLSASSGTWKGTPPLSFAYQWRVCASRVCSDIPGATAPTYRPTTAQIGKQLRVVVTTQNSLGTAVNTSPFSKKIVGGPPVNVEAPTVTGFTIDGQTLTLHPGTWVGTPSIELSYQWLSCSLLTETCTPVAGATGTSYTAGPLDVGNAFEVQVTARSGYGVETVTSAPTSIVTALLPSSVKLPKIGGLFQDGGLLSAVAGVWKGTEPIATSLQWQLCDATGSACSDINGAVGSALSLISPYIGDTVRVVETATNSAGSVSAASEPTSTIQALLPGNTSLPSITGLLKEGGLLSALTGGWTGSGPLSFAYQWQLCNSAGEACKDIEGAAEAALSIVEGEVGDTVRVVVTATNSAGSASAASAPTSVIGALLPSNTALPSISGLLQDGQNLLAAVGSWTGTGPISYGYQWQLCNGAGESCKDISGAAEAALALVSGDVGDTLRVVVTATNGAGSTSAASEPTSLIKALLPGNTSLPSISGLLQDGQSLAAAVGSWTGTGPLSYAYQWLQCNGAGESCKEISGATGTTLGLISSLVGSTVRLAVTATNSGGSTQAISEPTNIIKALLPGNTSLPSISGLLQDGQSLAAAVGSWTGTGPISYGYQWQQCNAKGEACEDISGATGTALGLISGLVGDTVRVVVTATNSGGSTQAASAPTSVVAALLPSNSGLPSIVGSLIDGQTLTASNGSWSGTAPISYGYQWQTCNAKGEACEPLSGATGATLGLISSLVGDTVRVVVTATNSGGSTQAASAPTSVIKALLPGNVSLPSIAGLAEDKQTLKGATGSWSGTTPISYSYHWQKCNAKGEECANLSGKTEETMAIAESLVGSTVRLAVKATNSGGSTEAFSPASSSVLAALPVNEVAPTIAGILQIGKELLAHHEKWGGTQSGLTYTYQWQLCGVLGLGGECKDIAGATKENILLELLDVGLTLRVGVTGHNERGASATAYSAVTGLIQGLKLLPSKGAAGTAVAVKGTGVNMATMVNFGETEVFPEVKGANEVVAEAPAGSGTVPVTVTTAEGTTHETPTTQFTYE